MALAALFSLKYRWRAGIIILGLLSLSYFGFVRKGCICPIGATQNVALALLEPGVVISVTAVLFFVLPLLAALLFGRVYCGGVCPHGAIQDILLLKALRLPLWLDRVLQLGAFAWLGLALVTVAAGQGFLICRHDPFISFFRLAGSLDMLDLGLFFLLLSTIVGRPYCRFLCPYGVLLRLASWSALFKVKICEGKCNDCGNCLKVCPFGAVRDVAPQPLSLPSGRTRLAIVAGVVAAASVAAGLLADRHLAGTQTAFLEAAWVPEPQRVRDVRDPFVLQTVEARRTPQRLVESPQSSHSRPSPFAGGGLAFGLWMAVVLSWRVLTWKRKPPSGIWDADASLCFSCGRCLRSCPPETYPPPQAGVLSDSGR